MIAQNRPDINDEGVLIDKGGKDCWLQTFSGRRVSVMNPRPEQISLGDIANSISKQCRFNGHCDDFYSVAQHCVLGANFALKHFTPQVAKEFLLHDATEAFVGDLIRPVKRMIPQFSEVEAGFWKAISAKFGLPEVHSAEVHDLDNIMVTWEKRDLLPNSEDWPNLPDITVYDLPVMKPVDWRVAREQYLTLHNQLFGETY